MKLAQLCVLALLLLLFSPTAMSDEQQNVIGGSLRVWVNRDVADTLAAFTIFVQSELYIQNQSGNISAVPNLGIASFVVYDVDQDLIIKQQSTRFFNGSASLTLTVDPLWTESLLNISVYDFEHGLFGYAGMHTEMSHEYQTWLLQSQIYSNFVEHDRILRTQSDARVSAIFTLALAVIVLIFVVFLWLFLRHDQTLSDIIRKPSYWERLKLRYFPWGLVYNPIGLLIDEKRTWDNAVYVQYHSSRLHALKARLVEDRENANAEIDEELRRLARGLSV